jgi:hypothetical protein
MTNDGACGAKTRGPQARIMKLAVGERVMRAQCASFVIRSKA